MTYDEMIRSLEELNTAQGVAITATPHCSNLLHQLNKKGSENKTAFNEIYNRYIRTRLIEFTPDNLFQYIERITEEVNNYMGYYWPPANNPFSHQADFVSSIIPEMFCTIFTQVISASEWGLEVSAQKDLAIECVFDTTGGGTMHLKNKRVDVAVVKQYPLIFNDVPQELPVPLLAIECKTNLDKNMLSGIEQSVNDLKKTFPECCYFVVTELSDFDVKKSNYASSGINEMYVLRQQKRGPVRKNPDLRNPLNASLVYEITLALKESIERMSSTVADLSSRMESGKLIGRII